jgi:hypothetical protein
MQSPPPRSAQKKSGPSSKSSKSETPSPQKARSPEVARLRALQRTAVASLDLVSAEEIQRKILSLTDDTFDADFKELHDRFASEVTGIINGHLNHVQSLKATEFDSIIEFRRHIHAEFEAMKSRHHEGLVALETEFAAFRLKESQRLIPEYEELVAQSKAAAMIGDFETAKEFQSMALVVAQKEWDKRIKKVDFDVRGQTESLLQMQQKDIETLSKKLNDGIAQIRNQTIKSIDIACDLKDVKLTGVLNRASKTLAGIATPSVDAMVYHRELENDLIAMVVAADLPMPKQMKVNPQTAMRASVKSPRKVVSPTRA